MHVCGTHQDTLVRYGLSSLLDECGIKIRQGPGCPVCVTTPKEIEETIHLARKGKTIATFGDMINTPGKDTSLRKMKSEGYDIKTVYGAEDAVSLARSEESKEIVFMGVGFETTAPTTASILLNDPPSNFSVLSCHRTMPNALKALLDMGDSKIDGLIEPGHVSTIIGTKPYRFISENYNIPQVVAGFEPIDILMASWMLVKQIKNDKAKIENEYTRVVRKEGNNKAQKVIEQVFKPVDKKWRGFPVIPKSGLELREEFEQYNARNRYRGDLEEIKDKEFSEPPGCKCGEVLRGKKTPDQCPLFGKQCTPESPVGPCMVSSEGSCSIDYKYSKR